MTRSAVFVALFAALFASAGRAADYAITTQTGQPIVPGATDIGNHCDDCTTAVILPFHVAP